MLLLRLIETSQHHEKGLDIDLTEEATKHVGDTILPKACNKWMKSKEQKLIFCFQVRTDVSITFS